MKIPKLRNNGDGRAFVEIPNSGRKRQYLGKWGDPQTESKYHLWVQQYLGSGGIVPTSSSDLTIADTLVMYDHYAKDYYNKDGRTTQEYSDARVACRHLIRVCGSEPMEGISASHLKRYIEHLKAVPYYNASKENIGLSRTHINKHLARIKRFVGWAEVEGYAPKGTHEHVKLVPGLKKGRSRVREASAVKPVSWETLQTTLPYLNPLIADMTQVQFLCGMRPQDVIGMRWDLIDQSEGVWFYEPEQHKGSHRGHGLVKAIPRTAQAILDNYHHREGMESIFCPKESILRQRVESYGNVSCRQTVGKNIRESYTNATYGKAVSDGCKRALKAGAIAEKWSPNQLRHGVATLLRSRMTPDHARAYLGHKGFDATEIYAEMDRRTIQDSACILDSLVTPHQA